jgi:hypothetical protein
MDIYDDILSDGNLLRRMMADDPRALAEWSRKMEGTSGDTSPEYEEMLERLDRGEGCESIVTDMQERQLTSSETEPSSEMPE